MFLQVWVIVLLRIQRTKYTHYTVVKLLFSQLTFLLVEKQWGPHTVNFNFKIWGQVTSTLLFWGFFASDLYTVSLLSCFSRLSFVSDLHTVNLRIFCSPCWDVSPGLSSPCWDVSPGLSCQWPLHCKFWGFASDLYTVNFEDFEIKCILTTCSPGWDEDLRRRTKMLRNTNPSYLICISWNNSCKNIVVFII